MILLPTDHIDLLVTALSQWKVTSSHERDESTMAQSMGTALRQANLASLHALERKGQLDAEQQQLLQQAEPNYVFTPVTSPFEPVDVLKASHAALQACAEAPQWPTSRLHRILEALVVAADQRMPGYDTAPWVWTRPEKLSCAIGFSGGQQPQGVPGLVWVDATTLDECWDSAVAVVLTPAGLEALDVTLPARRDLYVLHDGQPLTPEQWTIAEGLGPVTVVDATVGLGWLVDVLQRLGSYVPAAS